MKQANDPQPPPSKEIQKKIITFYNEAYKDELNLGDLLKIPLINEYFNVNRKGYGVQIGRYRITTKIQELKYNYLFYKMGSVVSCFKAQFEGVTAIYGYLLGSTFDDTKTTKITYISTGSTYRSQDGEYRGRVIPYQQFYTLVTRFRDAFDPIEAMVVNNIERGDLQLSVDIYYPDDFKENKKDFENRLNESRCAINLFMICWFHDFRIMYMNYIPNHITPAYQFIFYRPENIPLYISILDTIKSHKYEVLMHEISHYSSDHSHSIIIDVGCGMKIIPLTVLESIRVDDINYSVWRELYITSALSNLPLNHISPSFAFINNWFYIHQVGAGLFDNLSMRDKYLHSAIATDISVQIKNTDRLNYVNGDRKKGPVSNKFMRLSYSMQKSIVYADSHIRLTNLALCITSEAVGITFRDVPNNIKNNRNFTGISFSLTDKDVFAKHMFEFVYGLYCMNSKMYVIHRDLHLNNITLYHIINMFSKSGTLVRKDPVVIYIVENTMYMFKNYGLYGVIIDFSRAIIGNYKKIEHEFSRKFAEIFFKDQRGHMMNLIHMYYPKIMELHQEVIENLITKNFPLMFKVISVMDTYILMNNIKALFTVESIIVNKEIIVSDESVKLVDKLIESANKLFLSNITKAIVGKITSEDDIEWPNLLIIRECFADYIYTQDMGSDYTLTDIYNSNNEIINDLDDYETWGPLLSIESVKEIIAKYGINEVKFALWDEYMLDKDKDDPAALADKYLKQESEVLQYEPWMLQ